MCCVASYHYVLSDPLPITCGTDELLKLPIRGALASHSSLYGCANYKPLFMKPKWGQYLTV